jgi:hypothetical protein
MTVFSEVDLSADVDQTAVQQRCTLAQAIRRFNT